LDLDLSSAEAQLDTLIERRASAREQANAESFELREKERRRRQKIREENRQAWAEYYASLAECHALISAENERRARSLLELVSE
jgi:hypothetical protein